MSSKKLANMTISLLLGAVLSLAVLGVGLPIPVGVKEPSVLRIVTRGESTTAPSSNGERDIYVDGGPHQLEARVNAGLEAGLESERSPLRVKVFNLSNVVQRARQGRDQK